MYRLASLLGIESADQVASHHSVGNLFENMVVVEYLKYRYNHALQMNGYFWRDKVGHEIDLLVEKTKELVSIEIKSGKTINSDYFTNLQYWQELSSLPSKDSYVVYGGNEHQNRSIADVYGWKQLTDLFLSL